MKPTIMRAAAKANKKKGLIVVNTGDGKGKTTAALGVALRACGYGMRVIMLQFFKGKWKCGELRSAPKLWSFGAFSSNTMIVMITAITPSLKASSRLVPMRTISTRNQHDIVILDEINYALSYGFLPVEDVVNFLKTKPYMLHVILTGRNAKPEILEIADLATEMRLLKHPFREGISAQKGIEF